jgi:membrane protein implicated in regulation of membrane protease activity
MGHVNWWVMDIIGPAILLIVLIWLVMRTRSNRNNRDNRRSEQGARDVYAEEEQRRRDGTDDL